MTIALDLGRKATKQTKQVAFLMALSIFHHRHFWLAREYMTARWQGLQK